MGAAILITIVIIAVLAMIGLTLLLVALRTKSRNQEEEVTAWPFYAKKPLTPPEQILYFRLIQALPEHIVLAQVQLSRLLGVKQGHHFQSWNNRINRMSVDFVVCEKDSTIVAVIELDDDSHQQTERQAADAKKNKALAAAGVNIVRWQVSALPDVVAIRHAMKTESA